MSVSRKLFIAAVLLAAGFGVARLMGKPAFRLYAQPADAGVVASQIAATNRQSQNDSKGSAQVGSARLVPDFAAENPYRSNAGATGAVSPPTLSPSEAIRGEAMQPQSVASVANDDTLPYAVYTPRARLRNEAPRPLDFDNRPLATSNTSVRPQYPHTDAAVEVARAERVEPASTMENARSENWQTGASASGSLTTAPTSTATITASYSQPINPSFNQVLITAPPWPSPGLGESDGPRKHVIIDGDSLEKLAGRYLDDAQRSSEIYEANRELLTSPDLLPIGVELVIPDRASPAPTDLMKHQSSASGDGAIRAASHNMVPVRPIPPAAGVMPRAQLLPPRAVE